MDTDNLQVLVVVAIVFTSNLSDNLEQTLLLVLLLSW